MAITDPGELGTILGVWAHPDDEGWLSAGLMASAVAAGQRVVCITATRGELGVQDPERWPPETLGQTREAELMACLKRLGVSEHHWLDYADGGCPDVDGEEATARVRELIADVQPDTVLTFGPDGMTGHGDHKAVCAWTTAAFDAAPAGASLYYATTTPAWAERWVPIMDQHNVFMDPAGPPIDAPEDLGIEFRCDDRLADLKAEALAEHASQLEGMRTVLGEDTWHEAMIDEMFRLARTR